MDDHERNTRSRWFRFQVEGDTVGKRGRMIAICGGVCTKGAVIMRYYARQYIYARSYSTYRWSLKATSVRQDTISTCGLFSLKIYRNPNE